MIRIQPSRAMLCPAFAAVALVLTVTTGHALDNPGFEVPDKGAGGWEYAPGGASWTFAPSAGVSGPNGPWRCNSVSPDPLGNQFGYLQNASTISQDLTDLVVGAMYVLHFYESYRTAMFPSNDLSVVLDEGLGTEITIYTNAAVTNTTWEPRQTAEFVAAKTSYTLTFRTTNPLGGDRSTLIDGIVIDVVDLPGPPALIALDPERTTSWAAEKGLDPAAVHDSALLRDEIQRVVDEANSRYARVEQVKRFEILPRPLSLEDGELTPTMKIKRAVVQRNFSELVERMYAG